MAIEKGSILWVDDEVDLLKSQIMFLEERGYSVKAVANGEDAIQLIQSESYDLVLLDQMMPGLDGLSTFVKIKEVEPSMPVVMITKMEEEELIDVALRKRIDDFLKAEVLCLARAAECGACIADRLLVEVGPHGDDSDTRVGVARVEVTLYEGSSTCW